MVTGLEVAEEGLQPWALRMKNGLRFDSRGQDEGQIATLDRK